MTPPTFRDDILRESRGTRALGPILVGLVVAIFLGGVLGTIAVFASETRGDAGLALIGGAILLFWPPAALWLWPRPEPPPGIDLAAEVDLFLETVRRQARKRTRAVMFLACMSASIVLIAWLGPAVMRELGAIVGTLWGTAMPVAVIWYAFKRSRELEGALKAIEAARVAAGEAETARKLVALRPLLPRPEDADRLERALAGDRATDPSRM